MASGIDQGRRSFWLKHLHQWHWVSSALCLIGMLLFAITGITLNNARIIEARPQVTTVEATLPDALLAQLAADGDAADGGEVPAGIAAWLRRDLSLDVTGRAVEWSDDELYIALPRPGGDGWATIGRRDGAVLYEVTDRGLVSYLNDLHKGRGTGAVWSWFLDLFAVACLVFCVTGLFLLHLHAGNRPATWPLVGLGLVAPLLLLILLIH
ncbi:PepSY-associated TM helix domain-containing protein [Niveispirillum fermenti]|uniref:PepSY-associated TM helix domain-containing protein n=1 Tax=Niveispirillum fermenti TaxID=1233113 RepID=UPI003A887AA4